MKWIAFVRKLAFWTVNITLWYQWNVALTLFSFWWTALLLLGTKFNRHTLQGTINFQSIKKTRNLVFETVFDWVRKKSCSLHSISMYTGLEGLTKKPDKRLWTLQLSVGNTCINESCTSNSPSNIPELICQKKRIYYEVRCDPSLKKKSSIRCILHFNIFFVHRSQREVWFISTNQLIVVKLKLWACVRWKFERPLLHAYTSYIG